MFEKQDLIDKTSELRAAAPFEWELDETPGGEGWCWVAELSDGQGESPFRLEAWFVNGEHVITIYDDDCGSSIAGSASGASTCVTFEQAWEAATEDLGYTAQACVRAMHDLFFYRGHGND